MPSTLSERSLPDLEEHLGTHEEEAVDDPEGEDHRHRRNVEREEPRQTRNGELDIGANEVFVDRRKTSLYEMFEDALVEDGPIHRWTRGASLEVSHQRATRECAEGDAHL